MHTTFSVISKDFGREGVQVPILNLLPWSKITLHFKNEHMKEAENMSMERIYLNKCVIDSLHCPLSRHFPTFSPAN